MSGRVKLEYRTNSLRRFVGLLMARATYRRDRVRGTAWLRWAHGVCVREVSQ